MDELKTHVQIAMEKLESKEPIPLMTHPMSRYWDQPNRNEITIDATHALMSRKTFDLLHEYSRSIPTGAYEGKMWKAELYKDVGSGIQTLKWFLRWYGFYPADPTQVSINQREIIIG